MLGEIVIKTKHFGTHMTALIIIITSISNYKVGNYDFLTENGVIYNVILQMSRRWPKTVDNANLIASANKMLVGASFAPTFPIKIDNWWLAINENEDDFLKDCSFWRLYFRTAKFVWRKWQAFLEELL